MGHPKQTLDPWWAATALIVVAWLIGGCALWFGASVAP
jgi:hypothetical protein